MALVRRLSEVEFVVVSGKEELDRNIERNGFSTATNSDTGESVSVIKRGSNYGVRGKTIPASLKAPSEDSILYKKSKAREAGSSKKQMPQRMITLPFLNGGNDKFFDKGVVLNHIDIASTRYKHDYTLANMSAMEVDENFGLSIHKGAIILVDTTAKEMKHGRLYAIKRQGVCKVRRFKINMDGTFTLSDGIKRNEILSGLELRHLVELQLLGQVISKESLIKQSYSKRVINA
ncbi:hypothetical protein A3715_14010 [Oleiphilus sp. HI0009]|nr:hypothetical protein A3715_14010 [Oleiphilus sp. HI0009]